MSATESLYAIYVEKMQRIADVKYAAAVLQWDQETYLPVNGASARSRQLATLSELAHQLFTSQELGALLQELLQSNNLSWKETKNVALTLEEFEKEQKLSSAFVRKRSEAISRAFFSWIEARKQNRFQVYEEALAALVQIKQEEAAMLGYEHHPYNALLDQYERGATISMLDRVFGDVLHPLRQLMQQAMAQPQADTGFLHRFYPKDEQWKWGMYLIEQLGFDLQSGRQDLAEHPFSINFSAKDVRITTRIDENDIANLTWSCIHEAGHALYEQGLPDVYYGLPAGEYASLSIHESQSRLWENCVGRGRQFWQHQLPRMKQFFPRQLEDVSLDQFIRAINKVAPSLIRTEADEITYHFHVYIRYEIEKALIGGSLSVADLPARWNEMYEQHLGIRVPDDKQGCLQDVHWSHGSFGYFPTYSLGSFYAAQFWWKAQHDIPGLDTALSNGDNMQLLNWLRKQVHQHGKSFTSEELCKNITGKGLDSKLFIEYLHNKHLDLNQCA